MKIDRKDARILNALQRDARLTGEELGPMIHLSIAACNRRIKRLRDGGVIEAEVVIISPARAGLPFLSTVLLSLKREHSADAVERFKATIRVHPEVLNAVSVTGRWDFVLTIAARSPDRYEGLMAELRAENPDLGGSEALVVLDRVKTGYAMLIEAHEAS